MKAPLEREIDIEQLAIAMAEERITGEIGRSGLTGTAGGKALMKRAISEAEDSFEFAIEAWLEKQSYSRRRSSAYKFLSVLSAQTLTYLTSRLVINALAKKDTKYRQLVHSLAKEVLIATGAELFRQKDKEGFNKLSRQLNWQSKTYIRKRMAEEAFENACIEVDATDREELAIGATLVEVFCRSTELFIIKPVFINRGHSIKELQLTEKGQSWLADAMEANKIACPYHLPMVVPPLKWTTMSDGGYYLQNLHPAQFVRVRNASENTTLADADLSKAMAAVNSIQETGWTMNNFILDVWQQCVGKGLAGCSSSQEIIVPAAVDRESEGFAVRNNERREAFEAIRDNNAIRCVEAQKQKMADIFKDEPVMYFPHNVDFRGRIYPLAGAGAINPQGDDSGKALLHFADGKALGEAGVGWLFIHAQNVWGNDKCSLQERADTTRDNLTEYCSYALNPMENTGWMEADKPFCFLAVCRELLGYSIQGESYESRIPIALDGSCSGLQHFAGIMLDQKTAEAVNVVPTTGNNSADIYTAVAEGVQAYLAGVEEGEDEAADYWRDKVSRDVVKQPVMTLSYGVTRSGMKNQIKEKCKKLVRKGKLEYKDGSRQDYASYLADCIHMVIGTVAKAAFDVMDWLSLAADTKAKTVNSLEGALSWTTPIGLPVTQEYYEYEKSNITVFTEGRRIEFCMRTGAAAVKISKQKQGAAPNFVHSMDASHLMLTVNACSAEGLDSFAMIHDSFGTYAADTPVLFEVLREQFRDMYNEDVLLSLYNSMPAEVKADLPPPPVRGTLDLSEVLESDFFFA